MSNNEIEAKVPSLNQTPVLDAEEIGSSGGNGTVAVGSQHGFFWVGIRIPESLIFGGLGYVAGGIVGVYGGFYGLFLAGLFAIQFYFFV